MLNGQSTDAVGAFTCLRHNGSSTPDYMLIRGDYSHFAVWTDLLGALTDHAALYVRLPWALLGTANVRGECTTVYRWVDGTSLADYSHSWRSWNAHTDSPDFAAEFTAIIDSHVGDIESLATAVEQFLLRHAVQCGVVVRQERFVASNPNKRHK